MNRIQKLHPWRTGLVVMVMAFMGPAARLPAQERPGEVSGNEVYVRSGPSTNHYVLSKLNAGERVTIVGEQGEWFEILPPPNSFSYIHGDFVDTPDDRTGIVNGQNVRVRAGSSLVTHKYTVQTMLSKGTEVTILGRNPDGFLQIVPPEGATVWISKEFVTPVSEGQAAQPVATAVRPPTEDVPPSGGGGSKPTGPSPSETMAAPSSPVASSGSLLGALPPTYERRELNRIDADAEKEMAKPVMERQYQPLIDRYATIAGQEGDEFARRYALARIEQLKNMAEAAETLQKVRSLSEQTDARRREFMEARASLPRLQEPLPAGLDAQGELRVSALYPPGTGPRRFRLVDPSVPPGRTIGYVDVPSDSGLAVEEFIGKYVGVRASHQRLQAGGVDPVPIYVAREIVPLQPAAAQPDAKAVDQ